jgi:hypothetical protein
LWLDCSFDQIQISTAASNAHVTERNAIVGAEDVRIRKCSARNHRGSSDGGGLFQELAAID